VDFSVAHYGVTKMLAERCWRVEVNTAAEQFRQFVLHGDEGVTGYVAWFELDENVDVTVRAEVIA
jgi:hypothetical protein